MKTERITSRKNPAVAEATKLCDRRFREERREFFIEGIKLFCEAVGAGAQIKRVFVTDAALEKYGDMIERSGCGCVYCVTDEVYEKLTVERAPQGIFAVVGYFDAQKPADENAFLLVLDGVADPGNLGTIIRCADAFGCGRVLIGDNGVDLYNPKTVRAAMGSLFRVRTERRAAAESVRMLEDDGYAVYAATLDKNSRDLREVDVSGKVAFVIGNEGHGVSEDVAAACSGSVIIPMTPGAESLNAAVAASVIMWEAARVRINKWER